MPPTAHLEEPMGSISHFEIGGHYENRKGPYEVVSISRGRMRIRWDTGEEVETDIKGQLRVIRNMEREFEEAKASKRARVPPFYGEMFRGLQDSDFADDVTGTHWRSREQLGGAVAAHIAADFAVDSWSIYHRPEVHWADRTRYPQRDAWVQAKFAAVASAERIRAGLYVERSNEPDGDRDDWNRFIGWLRGGGEPLLAQIVSEHNLQLQDEKGDDEGCFPGVIVRRNDEWVHLLQGSENPVPDLCTCLESAGDDHWVDLLVKRDFPKDEAIVRGTEIATDIGTIFTALLPVYEAAAGVGSDE